MFLRDLLTRACRAAIFAAAVIVAPYVIEGAVSSWDDEYRIVARDRSTLGALWEVIACCCIAMMMSPPRATPVIHRLRLSRRQNVQHQLWSLYALWWEIACVSIAHRFLRILLYVAENASAEGTPIKDVRANVWVAYASTLFLPLAMLWPLCVYNGGVSQVVRCTGGKWVALTLAVSFVNVTLLFIWLAANLAR